MTDIDANLDTKHVETNRLNGEKKVFIASSKKKKMLMLLSV